MIGTAAGCESKHAHTNASAHPHSHNANGHAHLLGGVRRVWSGYCAQEVLLSTLGGALGPRIKYTHNVAQFRDEKKQNAFYPFTHPLSFRPQVQCLMGLSKSKGVRAEETQNKTGNHHRGRERLKCIQLGNFYWGLIYKKI